MQSIWVGVNILEAGRLRTNIAFTEDISPIASDGNDIFSVVLYAFFDASDTTFSFLDFCFIHEARHMQQQVGVSECS